MRNFIWTVVAFVIGGMIVIGIKNVIFEPKTSEQKLIKTVNEMNKRLPMTVDSETRLDTTIAGPGEKFLHMSIR